VKALWASIRIYETGDIFPVFGIFTTTTSHVHFWCWWPLCRVGR